jgi:hypothetical protein
METLPHRKSYLFVWILVGWLQCIRRILHFNQDLKFLQPAWIYYVSGEQLCGIALCDSQQLAVSTRRVHEELGFPDQFIFFRPLASNHVHSLSQFHLNEIED